MKTLTRHATQLTLGNVQPAPVFRGVNKVQTTNVGPGYRRFECFIERSLRVRVQIVRDQGHQVDVGGSRVKQMSDFQGPVGLRALFTCRRLPEPGQWARRT